MTIDQALYQALADIGCKICSEQLGCCCGGPPGGILKLADMILETIQVSGYKIVKEQL